MIKHSLVFLAFICSSAFVSAQYAPTLASFQAKKHVNVLFSGQYNVNSSFLHNEVFQASRTGAVLSDELLNRMDNSLNGLNRLYVDGAVNTGLSFKINRLGKKQLNDFSLFIAAEERYQINADIPDDAYRLLAFGNKMFENDSADLTGLEGRLFHYQKLSLGFLSHSLNGHTIAAAINHYGTKNLAQAQLGESYFITGANGLFLDAALQGHVHMADTSKRSFTEYTGRGVGVDLMYMRDLNMAKDSMLNGFFRIEIRDLGFIGSNDSSMKYDVNRRYQFEGIYIENLFDVDSASIQQQVPNLLNNSVVSREHRGPMRLSLPTLFRAELFQNVSQRWGLGAMAQYRIASRYLPLVEFHERLYLWGNQENFGAFDFYQGLGGFNDYYFGGQFTWTTNVLQLIVGSRNLDGILLPAQRKGSSAYVQCNFTF